MTPKPPPRLRREERADRWPHAPECDPKSPSYWGPALGHSHECPAAFIEYLEVSCDEMKAERDSYREQVAALLAERGQAQRCSHHAEPPGRVE